MREQLKFSARRTVYHTAVPAPDASTEDPSRDRKASVPGVVYPTNGRKRRTVALCVDYIYPFSVGYQASVRRAIEEQCRLRDVNLVTLFGRAINEPNPQSSAYNAVYDLVRSDWADGVIALSATLVCHCGVTGIAQFLEHFHGIPVCSLGIAIPNVPSVVLDNHHGMSAVMEHLIDQHGYRRIGFISGSASSPEAQARLAGYRDALARHGIAFDPKLVKCGDFRLTLGKNAMEEWIAAGTALDAVVAASDFMAMGARRALRENRQHLPTDLPLTGFDDIAACKFEDPPLTSVTQPYAAMGTKALELLLNQIEGIEVPEVTEVPARLALRRSCGCGGPIDIHASSNGSRNVLPARAEEDTTTSGAPSLSAHAKHPAEADEILQSIMSIGEQISSALDMHSLGETLHQVLPASGIRTSFIARYVGAERQELEAFVALHQGHPCASWRSRLPASRIFPPDVFPDDQRRSLNLFPIVFDATLQGLAIFGDGDDRQGHQMIRDQVASALRNVVFHQAALEQTKLHERNLREQEQQATTKRMEALSVLAGGVAHDLNNVLGPMVALPDIMLGELAQLDERFSVIRDLRADLVSIKASSLSAAQTIKDLLTLSRQGRTTKEPLDLARLLTKHTSTSSLYSIRNINECVQVLIEAPKSPVVVRASESHLIRAISNLVRNAVEAVVGLGQVVVRLDTRRTDEPILGFETILPGEYAVVTVSDTGSGVAATDLARLFEPFVSRKRLGEQSGSGLGLAIVHSVIKDHDGYIDVCSVLGSGTTFSLYLPLSDEPICADTPLEVMQRGTAKVLVVDDDPTQLRTCQRVLTHLGYDVKTVNRGHEACGLFERAAAENQHQYPFDLVILDMMLEQGMDGLALYERIRQLFARQKAIIVSGYAAVERAEAAVQSGLQWLVKPYTAEALAQAVHSALFDDRDHRRSICSSRPPTD